MNCAYHTRNPAAVQCSQCARPLCTACDHRIRGFPFCQDCIVAGVEMLRYQQTRTTDQHVIRRKTSPFVATLLSFFVPGLGAAYNGQTSKAGTINARRPGARRRRRRDRSPIVWQSVRLGRDVGGTRNDFSGSHSTGIPVSGAPYSAGSSRRPGRVHVVRLSKTATAA